MKTETLNGKTFLAMVKRGGMRLKEKREAVNDLNVFPIPDGDTGDNMLLTLESGIDSAADGSLSDVAAALSKGMLLGARGNSGVILSRIFAGIAEGLKGLETASVAEFEAAMACGIDSLIILTTHAIIASSPMLSQPRGMPPRRILTFSFMKPLRRTF